MVVMNNPRGGRSGWMSWVGVICCVTVGLVGVEIPQAWAEPPLKLLTGQASVPQLKEDGIRYMQLGFESLAVEAFRSALHLEDQAGLIPSQWDPDVPFNLGLLYAEQGNMRGARSMFQRSVEADPSSFKAHYQLGLANLQLGDHEAARQQFELLMASSPPDPQVQTHVAALLAALDAPKAPQSEAAAQADPEADLESVDPSLETGSELPEQPDQGESAQLLLDDQGEIEIVPSTDEEPAGEASAVESEEDLDDPDAAESTRPERGLTLDQMTEQINRK